jgi:SRSO17 transposase
MMVERAITAGVPFAWVAADSVYGVGEVEKTLRRAGRGYVLGVHANHRFGSWATTPLIAGEAKDIAKDLPAEAWHRLSAGLGTKGERFYDWAYCPLADLDAEAFDAPTAPVDARSVDPTQCHRW